MIKTPKAGFILTVYKDKDLARNCLSSLRKVYPDNPVEMITDGDDDKEWRDIAKQFKCELTYGLHLFGIESGAEYTRRILLHADKIVKSDNITHIFRIDTDTLFHREISILPPKGIFGRTQKCGEIDSVQGGCTGISADILADLLDETLFEKLKNPEESYLKDCPSLRTRVYEKKLTTWDWTLGWICKQKGISVKDHPQIGSFYIALPEKISPNYAVTHPHKLVKRQPPPRPPLAGAPVPPPLTTQPVPPPLQASVGIDPTEEIRKSILKRLNRRCNCM
jgi:hypothetical protein